MPSENLAMRHPGSNPGYRAPAVLLAGMNGDDDRLEQAGASDRTFETDSDPFAFPQAFNRMQSYRSLGMDDTPHIPPLPVEESWNEGIPPPLPEVLHFSWSWGSLFAPTSWASPKILWLGKEWCKEETVHCCATASVISLKHTPNKRLDKAFVILEHELRYLA